PQTSGVHRCRTSNGTVRIAAMYGCCSRNHCASSKKRGSRFRRSPGSTVVAASSNNPTREPPFPSGNPDQSYEGRHLRDRSLFPAELARRVLSEGAGDPQFTKTVASHYFLVTYETSPRLWRKQ